MLQDLRYAARTLLKSPGFTVLALLVLALGIGANVAIFGLLYSAVLRPVPGAEDPGELVAVYAATPERIGFYAVSYPDYLDFRETTDAFTGLAAHGRSWVYLDDGDEAYEIVGAAVSDNFFSTLGLVPEAGRFFLPEEDTGVDAHPVAVISHHLWQRQLHGDPGALGQTLRMNGVDVTVVGVVPPDFEGLRAGERFDAYFPISLARIREPEERDRTDRGAGFLDLVGRLAPGRTIQEARTQLEHRAALLAESFPESHTDRGVYVAPARGSHPAFADLTVELRLTAAVGVLLLIVCANLAGLMTARNARRDREIAVRLALGAGRQRLLRQLLTEGVLLAAAGGALGLAVARVLTTLLKSYFDSGLTAVEAGLNPQVTVFALTLSLLTGIAFAWIPALQASRPDLVEALKDRSGGAHKSPLRAALLTAQVALSFVLLIGAGLFLKSLDRLFGDPSFDARGVAHFRLRANRLGYDVERATAYHREVVRHLGTLPGVEDVVLARMLVDGAPGATVSLRGGGPLSVTSNDVTPGFFKALRIPRIAGRDFSEQDLPASPPVAVVNQALALRLWGGRSPLGETLFFDGEPYEVVGVVANTQPARGGVGWTPSCYRSFWQAGRTSARLFVRVQGEAARAIPELRRELARVDPLVHVGQVMPLVERVRMSHSWDRVTARLLGAAGAFALLLCAIGLYGSIAFAVARRTREFGIRAALGARAADTARLVLGRALGLVVLGLGLGAVLAAGASRFLGSLLYGVDPEDAVTFAVVASTLLAVALVAALVPALRAIGVDPAVALRHD